MRICKTFVGAAAGVLMFGALPALAQDAAEDPAVVDASADAEPESATPDDAAMMAVLSSMFAAEPLTEDQEKRLPLAKKIVDKMVPPGTYGEMMGSMFNKIIGPMMSEFEGASASDVAKQIGLDAGEIDLDSDQLAEVSALLDPAWQERRKLEMTTVQGAMGKMMTAMEPGVRAALSEAYAVYFDQKELTDIDAFFSTDSGVAFARKSFTMSSDPRFIAATMKALPDAMGALADMEEEVKTATAALPPLRGWADLSDEQRARLSELTGLSARELEEGMARAAEIRAEEVSEDIDTE
ncbi:hypothetical protein [Tsuneonella suprasediminis]|uniref:hypothetical protein n=1 Tax=Tsuneonella suprasediminis TaxID=2306996 RepID=UPI002F94C7CA